MAFDRDQVSQLLVQVHRRCCICHRFCGYKIETDHIVPASEKGGDEIENALPVCFECHAEIHTYNSQHPRGRKFTPEELREHKRQWIQTCRDHPELFVAASRTAGVGPLQALIDELEFNKVVSEYPGARFADEQFRRATAKGNIAILAPDLRHQILHAYAAMAKANQRMLLEASQNDVIGSVATHEVLMAIDNATPKISAALDRLLAFLGSEQ
jgi:hypothetical protein